MSASRAAIRQQMGILANYRALVDRAVEAFGDEVKASQWLSLPNDQLQGQTPLELAEKTNYDPMTLEEIFEPIFVRIEHGIYF
jgi:uncharacterized protein (DUF2384 family)